MKKSDYESQTIHSDYLKELSLHYHLQTFAWPHSPEPILKFLFLKWSFSSDSRWFLDAISHPRTSRGFIINGYLMGAAFFLCRILIMPIYYYKCYSVWGSEEQRNLGFLINFYWIFTCIVLDAINLYWFAKIVRGAMKLTRKMKDHRSEWYMKDVMINIII